MSPPTGRRGLAAVILLGALASCKGSPQAEVAPAPCNDDLTSVFGDPRPLPAGNGRVLRCGHDGTLSAAQVDQLARSAGYIRATLTSAAPVVRLSYSTERGTEQPQPRFSSAVAPL